MKRLLRRTFVATSLLLCLLSLTVWISSYFCILRVGYQADPWLNTAHGFWIYTQAGALRIDWMQDSDVEWWVRGEWSFNSFRYSVDPELFSGRQIIEGLWFRCRSRVSRFWGTSPYGGAIRIPLWFPTLTCSIIPLWTLRTHLRARREKQKGLCPRCGYDLRATPQRCPECGAVPTARATNQ